MSSIYPSPRDNPPGDQQPSPGYSPANEGQGISETRRIETSMGKPVVTYSILVLTILVFVSQYLSERLLGFDMPAALGVKSNAAIQQGQLWRLFTPMLLHGSILHIFFNMYALNALGPTLESYYNHVRFLILYILAGFAGNVVSFVFSSANSLGSSTAIFGLLSAYGMFLYQNRELLGGRGRRGLVNIIVIAGINLLIGTMPGIDNWGHLGGLVGGLLFAWLAGPKFKVEWNYGSVRLEDQRQVADTLIAALVVGLTFGGMLVAALLLN